MLAEKLNSVMAVSYKPTIADGSLSGAVDSNVKDPVTGDPNGAPPRSELSTLAENENVTDAATAAVLAVIATSVIVAALHVLRSDCLMTSTPTAVQLGPAEAGKC